MLGFIDRCENSSRYVKSLSSMYMQLLYATFGCLVSSVEWLRLGLDDMGLEQRDPSLRCSLTEIRNQLSGLYGILGIFSEVKWTGRETDHITASCVMTKSVSFYASAPQPIVCSFFNRLRPSGHFIYHQI
jgi:hypothetical protein